jgi:uncharacterized protein YuzE
MKLTYDPENNIAYIRLKPKNGKVRTVAVSDELNIDVAEDGSIYGMELLNANVQLKASRQLAVTVENSQSGESREVALRIGGRRSSSAALH